MECRFCGSEFDSERGLHVHQSEAHDEVRKEVREFLDDSVKEIKQSIVESDFSSEELIEAEKKLANRSDIIECLQRDKEHVNVEDLDEKIDLIDEIEEELEDSLRIQNKRSKLRSRKEELEKKKRKLTENLEAEEKRVEEEKKDLDELKEQRKGLESEVQEVQEDIKDLKKTKKNIDQEISTYRKKKKKMSSKIDKLYSKLSKLEIG